MQKQPLTVAVLMGGRASEHDISLKTGTTVVNSLDRSAYRILPIQIRRDGRWLLPDAPIGRTGRWLPAVEDDGGTVDTSEPVSENGGRDLVHAGPPRHAIPAAEIIRRGIDVVIVALHGRYGEDGCIQGLLETLGIPYTGSGVLGSALAMDKVRSKALIAHSGLTTPRWLVIHETDWRKDRDSVAEAAEGGIGYPCVVKIPEEGSSFGMAIPADRAGLVAAVEEFIGARGHVMIEEYIKGMEITGSVLGAMPGEEPVALPITEIVPKSSAYFDFEAKYTPGATEEITPARLDAELTARAQDMAVRSHKILDLGTLSRTDMIVRDGVIYYLETNTIPGFTETSLFPQAAAAAGIGFPALLDLQIELALAAKQ